MRSLSRVRVSIRSFRSSHHEDEKNGRDDIDQIAAKRYEKPVEVPVFQPVLPDQALDDRQPDERENKEQYVIVSQSRQYRTKQYHVWGYGDVKAEEYPVVDLFSEPEKP